MNKRNLSLLPIVFSFTAVFLCLIRVVNVSRIPIFWDEAIYLSIADGFRKEPARLLNSFSFYAYPVMVWIQTLLETILPFVSKLILGRVFLISTDFISAFLVFLISKKFYGKYIAAVSSLIYLALPLTVFHSRFVMLESITNMFVLLALYRAIIHALDTKNSGKVSLKWIVSEAFFISLSFFTKPLALVSFIAILILPLIILLNKKPVRFDKIKTVFFDLIFSFGLAGIIIAIFVLPQWHEYASYMTEKGSFTINSLIHFRVNLWKAAWWSGAYIGDTAIFLMGLFFIWALIKRMWTVLFLYLWILTVFVIDSLIVASFYPRHIYPISVPVAFILAIFWGLVYKKRPLVSLIALVFFLFFLININLQIIFHPEEAPIALEDKQQFFDDWSSGVALDKTAYKLNYLSKGEKYVLVTNGDPLLTWALVNEYKLDGVEILDTGRVWTDKLALNAIINGRCEKVNCFLVLNQNFDDVPSNRFTLTETIPKGRNRKINIYRYSDDSLL
ncbi:hypothetical protein MUP32_06320 [Candidatus Microgenomates bacterium]|nr:hypothetical protein [Candidatus Microgenomates bacterium]